MLRRERLLLGARTRSRYGDALVNYRVTCARSCRFRYPANFADQLSVHLPLLSWVKHHRSPCATPSENLPPLDAVFARTFV